MVVRRDMHGWRGASNGEEGNVGSRDDHWAVDSVILIAMYSSAQIYPATRHPLSSVICVGNDAARELL